MDDSSIAGADKTSCTDQVQLLFQDIDPEHLEEVARQHLFDVQATIAAILDRQEQGEHYPRRANSLKRKRSLGGSGEAKEEYDEDSDGSSHEDPSRDVRAKIEDPRYFQETASATAYKNMAMTLISQDFPLVPKRTINPTLLLDNDNSLYKTYIAIDEATRNWDLSKPKWIPKKTRTKALDVYSPSRILHLDRRKFGPEECVALDEFLAARRVKAEKDAEQLNLVESRKKGEMEECGCCFDEFPLNRMVHCEGTTLHWFCRQCMKQQAETLVGVGQFHLTCLSMDGCSAGYSRAQKKTFLDKKLSVAIDRNEAKAALEAAGIENLETCPFCPMAMEYPPISENKEFRCTNPSCEAVSCRCCRKQTHIPKTCAEAAEDEGQSARHTIEEAMSDAIIRKCNKCTQPYIKLDGCNKIRCTRCGTLQCYTDEALKFKVSPRVLEDDQNHLMRDANGQEPLQQERNRLQNLFRRRQEDGGLAIARHAQYLGVIQNRNQLRRAEVGPRNPQRPVAHRQGAHQIFVQMGHQQPFYNDQRPVLDNAFNNELNIALDNAINAENELGNGLENAANVQAALGQEPRHQIRQAMPKRLRNMPPGLPNHAQAAVAAFPLPEPGQTAANPIILDNKTTTVADDMNMALRNRNAFLPPMVHQDNEALAPLGQDWIRNENQLPRQNYGQQGPNHAQGFVYIPPFGGIQAVPPGAEPHPENRARPAWT
ncbi:hypothetical protein PFICI_05079 [Pestalotiopsis fici W106-1]|uniref:RING-type domain-containing protein n=1 Tax=Pestalotiopsis fici (strain W106-1 / CGMCC3.15140) TaxID=1229662 RepID=W3XAT4_PESFW|nr:uncharacterized protein PFICI_05079 [Pestalotiopsis fici W106-1]ETS83203.1 hypothetical protein PFICI_05079 [Pestalotiopsis fici W106-1]